MKSPFDVGRSLRIYLIKSLPKSLSSDSFIVRRSLFVSEVRTCFPKPGRRKAHPKKKWSEEGAPEHRREFPISGLTPHGSTSTRLTHHPVHLWDSGFGALAELHLQKLFQRFPGPPATAPAPSNTSRLTVEALFTILPLPSVATLTR